MCLKDKSLQDQWDLQTEQIWIRENSSKLVFWSLGGHIVGDFFLQIMDSEKRVRTGMEKIFSDF